MTEASQAERIVAHMMANDPFSQWLGVDVLSVRSDEVRLRMKVRREMCNGFGVCHGGVTFAFADSALAFVSNTGGKVTMSIENSIHYPTKVDVGDVLTAVAKPLSTGRRISSYEVRVLRGEEAVGHFRGTVYHTSRDHS